MKKISVVLATRNEEGNIGRCLESIKDLADEIVILDEHSKDKTVEIAERYNARVFSVDHEPIFHVTKQKALDKASFEWILQLDADETITPKLAHEIREVIEMDSEEILKRRPTDPKKWALFQRHQHIVERRDKEVGKSGGEVVAFFIPRINMFLGKPLIHAGVYPDPAIRLIKKNKAHFPSRSVHEIMEVDGKVAWLFNDMLHFDSPTLRRYLARLNRYTDLSAKELEDKKITKSVLNFFLYCSIKPLFLFLKLFIRHRGYKDGIRGFLWSFLSSMHLPISYYKYIFARV